MIEDKFLSTYQQAIEGELYQWRQSAEGRLAEIIVLDQFSRNMFRDKKAAFAYDYLAVALTQAAVEVFSKSGLESNLDFEYRHKKIIDQFGRYPHRNEILDRQST
ncbi:hypothetical protein MNBD_GAMMA02-1600, partial [hydrothermal vent metagenome]